MPKTPCSGLKRDNCRGKRECDWLPPPDKPTGRNSCRPKAVVVQRRIHKKGKIPCDAYTTLPTCEAQVPRCEWLKPLCKALPDATASQAAKCDNKSPKSRCERLAKCKWHIPHPPCQSTIQEPPVVPPVPPNEMPAAAHSLAAVIEEAVESVAPETAGTSSGSSPPTISWSSLREALQEAARRRRQDKKPLLALPAPPSSLPRQLTTSVEQLLKQPIVVPRGWERRPLLALPAPPPAPATIEKAAGSKLSSTRRRVPSPDTERSSALAAWATPHLLSLIPIRVAEKIGPLVRQEEVRLQEETAPRLAGDASTPIAREAIVTMAARTLQNVVASRARIKPQQFQAFHKLTGGEISEEELAVAKTQLLREKPREIWNRIEALSPELANVSSRQLLAEFQTTEALEDASRTIEEEIQRLTADLSVAFLPPYHISLPTELSRIEKELVHNLGIMHTKLEGMLQGRRAHKLFGGKGMIAKRAAGAEEATSAAKTLTTEVRPVEAMRNACMPLELATLICPGNANCVKSNAGVVQAASAPTDTSRSAVFRKAALLASDIVTLALEILDRDGRTLLMIQNNVGEGVRKAHTALSDAGVQIQLLRGVQSPGFSVHVGGVETVWDKEAPRLSGPMPTMRERLAGVTALRRLSRAISSQIRDIEEMGDEDDKETQLQKDVLGAEERAVQQILDMQLSVLIRQWHLALVVRHRIVGLKQVCAGGSTVAEAAAIAVDALTQLKVLKSVAPGILYCLMGFSHRVADRNPEALRDAGDVVAGAQQKSEKLFRMASDLSIEDLPDIGELNDTSTLASLVGLSFIRPLSGNVQWLDHLIAETAKLTEASSGQQECDIAMCRAPFLDPKTKTGSTKEIRTKNELKRYLLDYHPDKIRSADKVLREFIDEHTPAIGTLVECGRKKHFCDEQVKRRLNNPEAYGTGLQPILSVEDLAKVAVASKHRGNRLLLESSRTKATTSSKAASKRPGVVLESPHRHYEPVVHHPQRRHGRRSGVVLKSRRDNRLDLRPQESNHRRRLSDHREHDRPHYSSRRHRHPPSQLRHRKERGDRDYREEERRGSYHRPDGRDRDYREEERRGSYHRPDGRDRDYREKERRGSYHRPEGRDRDYREERRGSYHRPEGRNRDYREEERRDSYRRPEGRNRDYREEERRDSYRRRERGDQDYGGEERRGSYRQRDVDETLKSKKAVGVRLIPKMAKERMPPPPPWHQRR